MTTKTLRQAWYTVCPVPAASSLAHAAGNLTTDALGADVRLRSILSQPDPRIRQSHYDQTQPGLFREGGNIPPLWARSQGREISVIGLTWVDHFAAVIALDPRIESASDLKGRRLGLPSNPNELIDHPRATALHGYLSALESAGLSHEDVEFVDLRSDLAVLTAPSPTTPLSQSRISARTLNLGHAAKLRALVSGQVDALFVSTGEIQLVDQIGARIVAHVDALPERSSRVNNLSPTLFTVRRDLLDERPEVVDRYLARSLLAAREAQQDPAGVKRTIARDTAIAEEYVDLAYSSDVHRTLRPSTDPELIELLREQKDFLLRWGFLAGDVDIDELVDPAPLQRAEALAAGAPLADGPPVEEAGHAAGS